MSTIKLPRVLTELPLASAWGIEKYKFNIHIKTDIELPRVLAELPRVLTRGGLALFARRSRVHDQDFLVTTLVRRKDALADPEMRLTTQ